MDHPTVEQVISRDGISLVYFPLSTGEGGKAQEVVDNWSTWRFEYTEKEVDEMVELSKGNFLSGREEVKILVRGVWERKKRQRKERERKEREGVDGE